MRTSIRSLFAFLLITSPLGYPLLRATSPSQDNVVVTKDSQSETPGVESWSIVSPYQLGTNKVEVLLPSRFDPTLQYPVVYCLPVNAGTKGNWGHPLTEALRCGLADRYQAIFVTPSFHVLPWYGNNPENPLFRENEQITKAVIPFIKSHYPVRTGDGGSYLIGFSKSALGALALFLNDPKEFKAVAVFENWYGQPNDLQWNTWGFRECYGTRANYDLYDSQLLIAKHAAMLANGPSRITVLGGGPGPRTGVDQLMALLRDKSVPHVEIWDRSMSHDWRSGWMSLAVASLFAPAGVAPVPAK
jgi:Putative esterase